MTTKLKKLLSAASVILFTMVAFLACQKGETSKNSPTSGGQSLSVYLTDGPGKFDKLLMQISVVEVKLDTSAAHMHDDQFGDPNGMNGMKDDDRDDDHKGHDEFGQWDTLNIKPGTYDLLSLRNGVDTLLASGEINGTIRKIRITVGSVTVIKDSVSYPVTLLPGVNNYLYIRIHKEHQQHNGNDTRLWVDFDVARSVININGKYYLRPVLKPFCDNNFAEVEGVVLPVDAAATVSIYNATDTANAFPGKDGKYKVRGLKEGIYSITYFGSNGYRDSTINNISVSKGKDTRVATVTLHK
jgi:Domain of unknown function (DUF4382)/Carboxypeptidase regulatory-like domain